MKLFAMPVLPKQQCRFAVEVRFEAELSAIVFPESPVPRSNGHYSGAVYGLFEAFVPKFAKSVVKSVRLPSLLEGKSGARTLRNIHYRQLLAH